MRLLTCVVSYNRFPYLENCIESIEEFLPEGDLVVADTGSDDPSLLEYLARQEARGVVVLRQQRVVAREWSRGLNLAMARVLSYAIERGYDLLNLVQDDTQFVWRDPDLVAKALDVFERRQDALQVSYHFFKGILAAETRRNIHYEPDVGCYHLRPWAVSDLGFVSVERARDAGLDLELPEEDRNRHFYDLGFRRYNMRSPVLAWLPWPATHRGHCRYGRLQARREKFYLKPLSVSAVSDLNNRPLERLPFHEDFCYPWGWSCLTPYWFTAPSLRKYSYLLWQSARHGTFGWPHFVSASVEGRSDAILPTRIR